MVARETPKDGVQFLLQAIAECGNIDVLQLGPSVQSPWSSTNAGTEPPMTEVFTAELGVRIVYRANHCEEGSRFWKRSNQNAVAFVDDERLIKPNMKMFCWASLTQIKELALIDNLLAPSVKTIVMPL